MKIMAKKKEPEVIRFSCILSGIRTTIDGGTNVTISLPHNEIKALTQLLQVRNQVGVILEIAAVPVFANMESNVKRDSTQNRRKQRYPYRTNS
jgi:hypothetical protein